MKGELFLFLGIVSLTSIGYAELGLIGGQSADTTMYAAFVAVPSGNLTAINGLPTTANSNIFGVALNASGQGIIVGENVPNGYAALVNADGPPTPLSISAPNGQIFGAAINTTGQGLIGGISNGTAYTALVSPNGSITPLTLSASPLHIASVAINDAGLGLIGGNYPNLAPYAAYISPLGVDTTLDLTTLFPRGGTNVAIDSQGNGLIGGNSGFHSGIPFAALTTAEQSTVTYLTLSNVGDIISVAINDAGLGLLGGTNQSAQGFAGYVSNGTVTALTLSGVQIINSVALNASGQGIIGGEDESANVYAAFVTSSGTVTPLITTPPGGQITSVAIDDAGIGLIGGNLTNDSGYAALIAPNGALTVLDVSIQGPLDSVALGNGAVPIEVTSIVIPQSIGFLNSVFLTQLAASSCLESRFIEQNKIWKRSVQTQVAGRGLVPSDELLAANEPSTDLSSLEAYVKEAMPVYSSRPSETKNSIWLSPFADFFHLKGEGSFPSIRNDIVGGLLGYDRQGKNFLIGGALGYAYNDLHYGSHQGHGRINEEMGSLYGAYYAEHFWFDAAVWGGYYHFTNIRHTPITTSRGKIHGWIFAPHFEMASPWALGHRQRCFIELFAALDWVKNWQHAFTESGSSGFNLKMRSLHGSLLQSEAGFRFYERGVYGWGDILLEEKISYVNQAPFFDKHATTAFVSSAVGFPIAIGSTKVQNLGCVGLMLAFVPNNKSYPFLGFTGQATLNGSYHSYFVNLFTGWDF